jgi:IS5 family transposase
MKTKFTTANEKASQMYDLLSENEFFNFDMKDGDFYTSFTFENLTDTEETLLNDLFESLN